MAHEPDGIPSDTIYPDIRAMSDEQLDALAHDIDTEKRMRWLRSFAVDMVREHGRYAEGR